MNAKEQMDLLRDMIGEATEAHWSNVLLLRRLNAAQRKIALRLAMTPGQWLVKSASVTPVASVITLPADCAKPLYLEETATGGVIQWLGSVTHRRVSRGTGVLWNTDGSQEAYPLLNKIEVNVSSYTTACTLWYLIRVPDLHLGTAMAGTGASALELDDDEYKLALSFVDDYYNGVIVEVYDATSGIVDIRSEISDYAASTHIAVITGTAAEDDTYAMVSRLPEETHYLMVLEAAVSAMAKPSSNIDKDVWKMMRDELREERDTVYEWAASRIPGGGTQIGSYS